MLQRLHMSNPKETSDQSQGQGQGSVPEVQTSGGTIHVDLQNPPQEEPQVPPVVHLDDEFDVKTSGETAHVPYHPPPPPPPPTRR